MSRYVVLAMVLIGLGSCGGGADWVDFQAPDGSFSVSFPEEPEFTEDGVRKTWRAAADSAVFSVSIESVPSEYVEDDSGQFLEKFQEMATVEAKTNATDVGGLVLEGGHIGRQFTYLVGTRWTRVHDLPYLSGTGETLRAPADGAFERPVRR